MKNMDPLNDSVVLLLQNSSDSFVAAIWKDGMHLGICLKILRVVMVTKRSKSAWHSKRWEGGEGRG